MSKGSAFNLGTILNLMLRLRSVYVQSEKHWNIVEVMIKVGISHCLLGAKVRFDGGHKRDRFCSESLDKFFHFVPFCPEVGVGLPTPRKTLRLVGSAEHPRAVFSENYQIDVTEQLAGFADKNQEQLKELCGYIFCKASPSCGIERVKIYNNKGMAEKSGMGVFSARVKELHPLLPIEEDGRLHDPLLRDSFVKRVYIYSQWKEMTRSGLSIHRLFQFHARHKLLLLAHCQSAYRKSGQLLSKVKGENLRDVAEDYIYMVMDALQKTSTRKNNVNVLMHIQGYFKKQLSAEDKRELSECIHDYRAGVQPILAPLTLLKHYLKKYPESYLENQSYFEPYPKELAIRVSTH